MIFKQRYEWNIALQVILILATLTLCAWLIVHQQFIYLLLVVPVIIYQVAAFYRLHKKAQNEVEQFVESVHYRDFSRYFDVKHAPIELKPLRKGFNEINTTFKDISKEKETQYQYLQRILELVDTGILSYDQDDGEIVWMNESFKRLFGIPYLKTIHSLSKRDDKLYHELLTLRPGETRVATILRDRNQVRVLLSSTAFQTSGKIYKVTAFQNVNEALDETESKAWQKLLSVMTHEIMNSVAPISSLAETLKNRIQHTAREPDNKKESLEDLELGIDTIKRRSEGLLKFAETYRNLNKITTLNLKRVFVRDLFENLNQLMMPTLEARKIDLDIILKDTDLSLEVDTNLIEQVLINLVVNAMEAVKERDNPKIILSAAELPNKRIVIKVADNGAGIPDELLDKIFVPFFSTRKTGSGIGLSLCKQIMMLHRGNIQVQSEEGQGTAFILQF